MSIDLTDQAPSDGVSAELASFIEGLPKAELHVHLEGTLEPELKMRLAERNGVELPEKTVEEIRATYRLESLTAFLTIYYPAMRVLVTADDFHDLAYAYLTKAHSQGVVHAEMFFDPQAHTSRGVPFDTVISGYRRACVTAERELGMTTRLIMCFLRDMQPEYAMATLMEALPYKEWIIAVGLDSDERDNPPSKFAAVFARARQEGFFITSHCDIDQPGSIDHIGQVLHDIGVDRIDHGTNIVEDPALVDLARERGIGFTCCPISNEFVTGDMKAGPISDLLRSGVRVTCNSDDPSYFGTYITENFLALAAAADLSTAEVLQLARNAFEVAWLSPTQRDAHLAALDAYAAEHGVAGPA
jgi:adenosine deaminase